MRIAQDLKGTNIFWAVYCIHSKVLRKFRHTVAETSYLAWILWVCMIVLYRKWYFTKKRGNFSPVNACLLFSNFKNQKISFIPTIFRSDFKIAKFSKSQIMRFSFKPWQSFGHCTIKNSIFHFDRKQSFPKLSKGHFNFITAGEFDMYKFCKSVYNEIAPAPVLLINSVFHMSTDITVPFNR